MKNILFVATGQSNWQGAAKNESGSTSVKVRSKYKGTTDPYPGCNNINQGGSCFPFLIDLCFQRGVNLDVLNYAIGGASVFHYSGRVGASVTGGLATLPAQQGYMSPVSLSGGAATAVEGNGDFDPFSLCSRTRAAIAAKKAVRTYDAVVSYWQNGESDAGVSSVAYAGGLSSVGQYMIASGADAHFIGLSSKQASATVGDYNNLTSGIDIAVAGNPKFIKGHSLYTYFGSSPPLYAESDATSYVHMTLRGQEIQAALVNQILKASGF